MFSMLAAIFQAVKRHCLRAKCWLVGRTDTPETKENFVETIIKWDEAFATDATNCVKNNSALFDAQAAHYYPLDNAVVSSHPGGDAWATHVFVPNKGLLEGFKQSNLQESFEELGQHRTRAGE